MATINGTIDGVQFLGADASGGKLYVISCSFAAYTGASDSATVTGIGAAINSSTRNGKTAALVAGCVPVRAGAGYDTNGQAVYFGTATISGDGITGNLTNSAQTEITTATASSGVRLAVWVQES